MSIETQDELASMLDDVDGVETFTMETGEAFRMDFNQPSEDGLNVRGFNPSGRVLTSVAERVPRQCHIWRSLDRTRFEVHDHEPFGDGSFTILHLRARA